ncbi:MAG: RICIN domain-containing protein, partial [Coriobacteriales bacterium]|nr:RICIN domain-containing protein [Coriobacteriales bacterium]
MRKKLWSKHTLLATLLALVLAMWMPCLAAAEEIGGDAGAAADGAASADAAAGAEAQAGQPAAEAGPDAGSADGAAATDATAADAAAATDADAEESGLATLAADNAGKAVKLLLKGQSGRYLSIVDFSLSAGAAVVVADGSSAAAQRFQLVSAGSGYYRVVNVASRKVLDVFGGQIAQGTAIIQWDQKSSGNLDNQLWKLKDNGDGSISLLSKADEAYCLEAAGSSVYLASYSGGNTQRFVSEVVGRSVADGLYRLNPKGNTSKSVDIYGNSSANVARAIVWTNNTGLNQRFQVKYDANSGYYTIVSASSLKALDVEGNSTTSGAAVIQYTNSGAVNQLWDIRDMGSGNYALYSARSGKALDIEGANYESGKLLIWEYGGRDNQLFKLNTAPLIDDGLYNINAPNSAVLDIQGAATTDGAKALIWKPLDQWNQKFYIKLASGNSYTIEAIHAAKYLSVNGSGNVVLGSAQKWTAESVGEGRLRFTNENGKVLDISGGSTDNGSTIVAAAASGSSTQSWKLLPAELMSGGMYRFSLATNT